MTAFPSMDFRQILSAIPHRHPFLFVDAVIQCADTDYVEGYKNITLSEDWVYPLDQAESPRFPESLVTEAMAQVGAVAILSCGENKGKIMLFAAVENLRFYHPVFPGDRLVSRVRRVFTKATLGKMKATASVGDRLVAEGEFTYALADQNTPLKP